MGPHSSKPCYPKYYIINLILLPAKIKPKQNKFQRCITMSNLGYLRNKEYFINRKSKNYINISIAAKKKTIWQKLILIPDLKQKNI